MSYLYKKPTKRNEYPKGESMRSPYGKASIEPLVNAKPVSAEPCEVVIPQEKIDVIGSHITEISYEEHLKNLELMCKTDREFMKRVRLFCEENKEQNFPDVEQPLQHPEPASQHEEGSE